MFIIGKTISQNRGGIKKRCELKNCISELNLIQGGIVWEQAEMLGDLTIN